MLAMRATPVFGDDGIARLDVGKVSLVRERLATTVWWKLYTSLQDQPVAESVSLNDIILKCFTLDTGITGVVDCHPNRAGNTNYFTDQSSEMLCEEADEHNDIVFWCKKSSLPR